MKLDRPLEGERIVIRSYAPEDLDFCTGMWFDPENGRYLSDPAREYVDEVFQRALDGLQDSGDGYYLVVERKDGGERIGTCCAFPDEAGKVYDIGYCVHRSCWRQGFGREIVELLRQRSRPYLFSNTLAPAICAASIRTIELLTASTELRDRVHENTAYFREKLSALGFDVLEGSHPIVAVMLYDARTAGEFAARMLEKGVYVVGFSYPVVPQGRARIRTQVSAGHTREDLDFAVECFRQVKAEMGL